MHKYMSGLPEQSDNPLKICVAAVAYMMMTDVSSRPSVPTMTP